MGRRMSCPFFLCYFIVLPIDRQVKDLARQVGVSLRL